MRAVLAMGVVSALLGGGPSFSQGNLTMLEGTADRFFAIDGTLKIADPAALDLSIVFSQQEDGSRYLLHLTGSAASLERVMGGQAVRIGRGVAPTGLASGQELRLTVRRDAWRIALILGNQVLVRAYDSALSGGQAGYSIVGGELTEVMVQPLGEVYLTDDFVREEDAQSAWEPVQGTWQTQSLRVDEQSERMEADKSANAFSYWGKGEQALAVTGYWFWSNYSVRAAIRPAGTDVVGLIAYYQDPENYLLARWTSALAASEDANQLQLIQVTGGEQQAIAQARGGHLPEVWYSMKLSVCDDLLQCFVDDELKLSTHVDVFGQGHPGLFCQGDQGTFFDSVAIEDWEVLSDTFDSPCPGRWAALSGAWENDGEGHLGSAGNGERLCATGRDAWDRYIYAVDLYSDGPGVGLMACRAGDAYYLLRFGPSGRGSEYAGKSQLIKRTAEGRQTLAEASAQFKPASWHRAKLSVDEGLITAYLDGKRILDAFDADAVAGQVGLYADGKGSALFDNAYLYLLPEKRSTRLTKEFTEGDAHPEMVEWASTRAPWIKPAQEAEGALWWTKGDYYGDKTVQVAIPSVGSASGSLNLWLESVVGEQGSGLRLVIEATAGSKTLKVRLLSGEQVLEQAEVETASNPCPVLFERKGAYIVVSIDGKVVINRNA